MKILHFDKEFQTLETDVTYASSLKEQGSNLKKGVIPDRIKECKKLTNHQLLQATRKSKNIIIRRVEEVDKQQIESLCTRG